MVVMVLGLPGSGKSYFAERLAGKIHAEYISSDRVRKELFTERFYSPEEKAAVYEEMLRRMRRALLLGGSVVLDATFHDRRRRELFIKKAGRPFFLIDVRAPESLIKERLKERRQYSEADYKVYQLIRSQWEPLKEPHLSLESSNSNIDHMLATAVEYLSHDRATDL